MLKITVYEAKDGWRWHAKRSGRIMAESGEAYVKRSRPAQAAQRAGATSSLRQTTRWKHRKHSTVSMCVSR